ncbi:ABC transporter substrate-binding protein [Martelella endophytica]|uniref:ABC transporter substrate-binding protein n=1 Tax=Martelella endophytica TaxID=1486262 RepID=UPI00130DA1EA|nr:ABC transporter substrate-binding protein [Martelella endophytica]
MLHDLEDRTVTLEAPAKRLLIDDGRIIFALSFMDENPASLIAAWPHDVDRLGRLPHAALARQFPEIDSLPNTGSNASGMSAEAMLSVDPDLVVLSVYSHFDAPQLRHLEDAGVPVIFVDFVSDPLENADKSLLLLGQATGHEDAARKLVAFRKDHREAVEHRLQQAERLERPSLFLEAHASATGLCCFSPGRGGIGTLIAFAGAKNVGDALGGKPFGQLTIEASLARDPDIYVASGGAYMKDRDGLLIGPGFSAEEMQQSLSGLLARPGFSALSAVRNGRIYGIDKHLFDPVVDILALELLAKWAHPDLFEDLDIDATRKALDAMTPLGVPPGYWSQAEE